jgi:hypothetical protein
MGALRVMSYTFDILRAGKQNCALAEIFPLRTPRCWWEFLAHRTNLLSGRVVWRKLRHSTFFFFIGGGGGGRNHSKQEMRRERLRKLNWFVLHVGALWWSSKRAATSRACLSTESIAIATNHHLLGVGVGVEPAPYCCAWVSIKTWCGSSTTAPLRNPRALCNAYTL